MIPKQITLSSPIEEKIAWSRYYYLEFGEALLREKRIADSIETLEGALLACRREMALTGIEDICRKCERDEGGSCCGAGIEDRYDGWLLLINLLLGVKLPDTRLQGNSCFLLGEEGCLLAARHVICINYLCKKLTDQIDHKRIIALREKEGREVSALFTLHEGIKQVLRKWIND